MRRDAAGATKRGFWRLLAAELDKGGPLRSEEQSARRRERERRIVAELARETVRSGFGAVGVFLAEASKPLAGLGAHVLNFFGPSAGLVLGDQRLANLACLLEDRSNLELFIRSIERYERDGRSGRNPGR